MKCRVIKIIIFSSECCASSIRENPKGSEGLGGIGQRRRNHEVSILSSFYFDLQN